MKLCHFASSFCTTLLLVKLSCLNYFALSCSVFYVSWNILQSKQLCRVKWSNFLLFISTLIVRTIMLYCFSIKMTDLQVCVDGEVFLLFLFFSLTLLNDWTTISHECLIKKGGRSRGEGVSSWAGWKISQNLICRAFLSRRVRTF